MSKIVGYIPPVNKEKKPAKDKPEAPEKDTGKDKKTTDKEASE